MVRLRDIYATAAALLSKLMIPSMTRRPRVSVSRHLEVTLVDAGLEKHAFTT